MDWNTVEREYVEGRDTYRGLAEKYGLSPAALAKRGTRQGWVAKRREYMRRNRAEYGDNMRVMGADRPIDVGRTREKLLAMADHWADQQAGAIEDTGDYRRVVQSVLDLGRAEGEGAREVRVVLEGNAGEYSV